MKKASAIFMLVTVSLLLASCAAQPPSPGNISSVPGFWMGLIHGFIAPFALIASIFTDVRVYAFPNGGGWYDFGFMLGIGALSGGGSRAA